jgi:radial spoke head protein 3
MNMQTENFLEELTDKRIEIDAETQTQAFLDRPASPLFVMARTGVDAVTQILSNDLFDFDSEVAPILEVLVGKTLHVAMLELMQEEELEVT